MKVLITGAAGFIGHFLAIRLLARGDSVVGVDNLNDYYDVNLKRARLDRIKAYPNFTFIEADIADRAAMATLFDAHPFDVIVNIAAQAGVRYSVTNPQAYIDSNIQGFLNVLEGARQQKVGHFVFASSSSVYGGNKVLPFAESHSVDHPISLYAATKKANELIAHSYASLFQLPCTGLRFFTVYGPWGRPDMALFKFTKAILAGEAIPVFNHGNMTRDFTYVDDVVDAIVGVIDKPAAPDADWGNRAPNPATSFAPYRIYNVGNNTPVPLMRYIEAIEKALGRKAVIDLQPMQAGDVPSTAADITSLTHATGFRPSTNVEEGVARFVEWYLGYYCSGK